MNKRSSSNQSKVGHVKATGHTSGSMGAGSTGTAMRSVSCQPNQSAPRWLPKQRRTGLGESTDHSLSQADQDVLLRQRALTRAQQGEYPEAIALFGQLIQRHPDNANDYSNRGLVYFQSGLADEAIADYNRAISLNPRLDSAYNNRANYYAAQGHFLEAILDYDIALDLNPANVRAWINQGITFRELNMYDRAIESFDLALHMGRLEGHIYAERGRTYHLRGDWNYASADYQRALVELPAAAGTASSPSSRLRDQVEVWLDELLRPLR